MKVVILAGGKGTRLQEETRGLIPKPMVRVGDIPLIEHIVRIYIGQGFTNFVIAAGYRWEEIRDWFLDSTLGNQATIEVVNTGQETQTAGRLRRLALEDKLPERDAFMLTYGDGVADLNLVALLDHHYRYDCHITLTAVKPPSRFGHVRLTGGLIGSFSEKPRSNDWINGGFYVVNRAVVGLIPGPFSVWEKDVLPHYAHIGKLGAFRHIGYWQMCDTPRDLRQLERVWVTGEAPWARWRL